MSGVCRPETDRAERAAGQLVPDILLLTFLDRFFDFVIASFQRPNVLPSLTDVASRQEQARDDELLDGVCVRAGRIEDGYPALREPSHGYVVRAGTRTSNRFDARRNLHRMHIGRA